MTVPGPSPVSVQFNGHYSTGPIVLYQWFNQWGLLRAEGGSPVFEVNFGGDSPPPGTKRTFTLVITNSAGNVAKDKVTVTLGESPEAETEYYSAALTMPEATQAVTGSKYVFTSFTLHHEDGNSGGFQTVHTGLINNGTARWWVYASSYGLDGYAPSPEIVCERGNRVWEGDYSGDDYNLDSAGCLGHSNDVVAFGQNHLFEIIELHREPGESFWEVRVDDTTLASLELGASLDIYEEWAEAFTSGEHSHSCSNLLERPPVGALPCDE